MIAGIFTWSLLAAEVMLVLSLACAVFRMVMGPRARDRVLGLNTFSTNAVLVLLTFGIRTESALYFEAALVLALLGFLGTLALAKFLLRGEVIE